MLRPCNALVASLVLEILEDSCNTLSLHLIYLFYCISFSSRILISSWFRCRLIVVILSQTGRTTKYLKVLLEVKRSFISSSRWGRGKMTVGRNQWHLIAHDVDLAVQENKEFQGFPD